MLQLKKKLFYGKDFVYSLVGVGMAMGRGGAGRGQRMGSSPPPRMDFSCPIPALPRMTGKISCPIPAP